MVEIIDKAGYTYLLYALAVFFILFAYEMLKAGITDPGVILRHKDYEDMKIKISPDEIKRREDQVNTRIPTLY